MNDVKSGLLRAIEAIEGPQLPTEASALVALTVALASPREDAYCVRNVDELRRAAMGLDCYVATWNVVTPTCDNVPEWRETVIVARDTDAFSGACALQRLEYYPGTALTRAEDGDPKRVRDFVKCWMPIDGGPGTLIRPGDRWARVAQPGEVIA